MGPLFYFGGGRMDGIPTRNLTLAFSETLTKACVVLSKKWKKIDKPWLNESITYIHKKTKALFLQWTHLPFTTV